MAKFSGVLGFSESLETKPGVYTSTIIERHYKGDLLRDYRKWENAEKLNDDLTINNQISVVADLYAREHLHEIKYVYWNKGYWKVGSVDLVHPRIIIHLGGVYNGPRAKKTPTP